MKKKKRLRRPHHGGDDQKISRSTHAHERRALRRTALQGDLAAHLLGRGDRDGSGFEPAKTAPWAETPARRLNLAFSALVGFPARLRLGAGLFEVDVLVHVIDPRKRNEVMLTAGIRIVLRQLDLIPA